MSVSSRHCIALMLLLTTVLSSTFSPPPAQAATAPAYTLDAALEYDSGLVTVREAVAFTNQTSQTIESLVFNVIPAHYNAFQLFLATAAGQPVNASLDGSILELPLPTALPPGGSLTASLDFSIKVPFRGGRFGRGAQAIAMGNWFPILAVYRDARLIEDGQPAGWVKGQYVEIGDAFFSESADFQVTLRTDQPLKVAHTGELLSQEGDTWKFAAHGVRDFAMAISPSFNVMSEVVAGVEIRVFYLPGHQASASGYLQAAAGTASWLGRVVLAYPHKHLDLAEINAETSTTVGQEYPGLIFMADNVAPLTGGTDSYGSVLASHETAHQWFYGVIGNDQLYQPWLDEAMVTWLSYDFLRVNGISTLPTIWQNRVLNPPLPSLPVNAGVYSYDTEGPYLAVVYRRGAVFLEELYQAMGDEAFWAALKYYGSTMAGRLGTPYAFLDTMQRFTQVNLNPLIRRYFSYPRYGAAEPLRFSARYPDNPWSGTVKITLDSGVPLQQIAVFLDDRLYMRALPDQVVIDTARLDEGPHLLTLRLSSGEREVDVIGLISVKRPDPTPTPTAAPPTPTPVPPTPTAAPERKLAAPEPAAQPAGGDRMAPSPLARDEVKAAGVLLAVLAAVALAWGLASGRRD